MIPPEIEYMIWGLFFACVVLGTFSLAVLLRTHALLELKAQIKKKSITVIGRKEGGAQMKIANKVKEGFSYFKNGKTQIGYILPSTGSTQIGSTKYNFAIEDRAVITPPHILVMAQELKNDGFENCTQMEIAYYLKVLENKYKTKIMPGTKIKVTDEKGQAKEYDAIEFAKDELLDLTPFAWMRPGKAGEEVEEVIYRNLHHIPQDDAFVTMRNYHKYNAPPSVVENIIASDVAASKKEQQLGLGGLSLDQLRGLAIFLLIAAVVYMMLVMTGSLDGIMNFITGGGGAPAAPQMPTSPLSGGGISIP